MRPLFRQWVGTPAVKCQLKAAMFKKTLIISLAVCGLMGCMKRPESRPTEKQKAVFLSEISMDSCIDGLWSSDKAGVESTANYYDNALAVCAGRSVAATIGEQRESIAGLQAQVNYGAKFAADLFGELSKQAEEIRKLKARPAPGSISAVDYGVPSGGSCCDYAPDEPELARVIVNGVTVMAPKAK